MKNRFGDIIWIICYRNSHLERTEHISHHMHHKMCHDLHFIRYICSYTYATPSQVCFVPFIQHGTRVCRFLRLVLERAPLALAENPPSSYKTIYRRNCQRAERRKKVFSNINPISQREHPCGITARRCVYVSVCVQPGWRERRRNVDGIMRLCTANRTHTGSSRAPIRL